MLLISEPPKIQTDIDVIFQNDTFLCFVWTYSKDEAKFDEISTQLMQSSQILNTLTTNVADTVSTFAH